VSRRRSIGSASARAARALRPTAGTVVAAGGCVVPAASATDDPSADATGGDATTSGSGVAGDGDAAAGDGAPVAWRPGGAAGEAPADSSVATQSANWPTSFPPTSAIMPRPNCAGLPVTVRSVTTSTEVVSPSPARI